MEDDRLITHLVRMREVGNLDQVRKVVGVLAHRRLETLTQRIRLRYGLEFHECEDVACEAMASAIGSSFDGEHLGQFQSWLHTIAMRRAADRVRRLVRERPEPLADENREAEGQLGVEIAVGDLGEAVLTRRTVEAAIASLDERKRMVVELTLAGFKAREIASEVNRAFPERSGPPMSEANVHQIMKRFRDGLRPEIEER